MTDENEIKNNSAPFVLGPSIFTGDGIEFKDIAAAREWANNQLSRVQSEISQVRNIADFDTLNRPYDSIMKLGLDSNKIDRDSKRLNAILIDIADKGTTFTANSQIVACLKKSQLNNEERAGFLSAIFNIDQFPNGELSNNLRTANSRSNFVNGYVYAFAARLVGKSNLAPSRGLIDGLIHESEEFKTTSRNQLEEITTNLENNRTHFDSLLMDSETKLAKLVGDANSNLDAALTSFDENKERITSGFKEYTSLHDAVEYWDGIATQSEKLAARGLWAFGVIGCIFVVAILLGGPTFLKYLIVALGDNDALKQNPFSYLGFLSIPTLIILWGLKFPARIFKEQMHKRDDALHRVTIIRTYLSLLRDETSPINPNERAYALSAVFGRTGQSTSDEPIPVVEEYVRSLKRG